MKLLKKYPDQVQPEQSYLRNRLAAMLQKQAPLHAAYTNQGEGDREQRDDVLGPETREDLEQFPAVVVPHQKTNEKADADRGLDEGELPLRSERAGSLQAGAALTDAAHDVSPLWRRSRLVGQPPSPAVLSRMTRAGAPTQTAIAGNGFTTTDPAPTTLCLPTRDAAHYAHMGAQPDALLDPRFPGRAQALLRDRDVEPIRCCSRRRRRYSSGRPTDRVIADAHRARPWSNESPCRCRCRPTGRRSAEPFLHEIITPCDRTTSLAENDHALRRSALRASRMQPLPTTLRSPMWMRCGCISVTFAPK